MKIQVTEILIQCDGALEGTFAEPSWHVQVTDFAETMEEVAALGGLAKRVRVLNMTQAFEQKLALPLALSDVARQVALRFEALQRDMLELRLTNDELAAELARLQPPPAVDSPSRAG